MHSTHKLTKAAFGLIAAGAAIAAAPAGAEAPNYVAPVAQPAAGTGVTNDGADNAFHQLYASWDGAARQTRTIANSVSVPSRAPVEDARLTSGFGMREHPVLGGRRIHKGVDLAAPRGTPIYAPADGVVAKAGPFSSYGNFIEIEHGADMETRYGHLSKIAVREGERVKKGELIGYVGSTGRSTGPHLHYEVRVDGQAVDPMPYMKDHVAPGMPVLAMAATGAEDDND